MHFEQTPLPGTYLIDLEAIEDERGFFARVFCAEEFRKRQLDGRIVQINTSLSQTKGTLRGMHYQLRPCQEAKTIRCIHGAVYDVALDVRPGSATFGQWFGAELTAENRRMLYVPRGCAHGFLTLRENTEVLYVTTAPYSPQHERGIRWDDPRFTIAWPMAPTVISPRDRTHPDFDPEYHLATREPSAK